MKDYTKTADTAQRSIAKFGQDGFLIKRDRAGAPNSWDDGDNSPTNYPTKAVIVPLSNSDIKLIGDSQSVLSSSKALIESVELIQDVSIGDVISVDEDWQITHVKQIKPTGTTVLWSCIVVK
jgi:hypothetical protein